MTKHMTKHTTKHMTKHMTKHARATKRKRPRVAASSDSDSDDEEDIVQRDGTTIFFHCDVSTKTVLQLIRAIKAAELHAFANGVPHITLCVHSYGGCAFAGLSAYDHIRGSRVPIHTVATGFVASAATILCLGGKRRFAHRHTCLLIHELSTGMEGKLGELVEEVSNSKVTMRMMQSVYEQRTNRSRQELKAMLKKETMLPFEKAVKYGFIEGEPSSSSTQPSSTRSGTAQTVPTNTHIRWPS